MRVVTMGKTEHRTLGRRDGGEFATRSLEQGAPALIALRQENQKGHLAEPVAVGVSNELAIHDAASGPGAVRVRCKIIAHTVAVKTKPCIEA